MQARAERSQLIRVDRLRAAHPQDGTEDIARRLVIAAHRKHRSLAARVSPLTAHDREVRGSAHP